MTLFFVLHGFDYGLMISLLALYLFMYITSFANIGIMLRQNCIKALHNYFYGNFNKIQKNRERTSYDFGFNLLKSYR